MENITIQVFDFKTLLFIATAIIGFYIFVSLDEGRKDD